MSHYHPVSYEAEARIRQEEKWGSARRHRQSQAARAGRSHARSGSSFLALMVGRLLSALFPQETEKAPTRSPGPSH